MGDDTGIQWTDATWNPVTGCAKVSRGCKNCYAEKVAERFWRGRKFTDVQVHPDRLDQPLRWTRPRRVFVNSMSDLFHADVPEDFIDRVFAAMALAPQHTFQILTKRPERMLDYVRSRDATRCLLSADEGRAIGVEQREPRLSLWSRAKMESVANGHSEEIAWPLPNVWLGVSVEDQRAADERIPLLIQTPAAVRFLSCEPLLGPVDLHSALLAAFRLPQGPHESSIVSVRSLHWVIVGGESGPGARSCDVSWIRSLVAQCRRAGLPAFVKQLGAVVAWNGIQGGYGDGPSNVWPSETGALPLPEGVFRKPLAHPKGGDPAEWPEDLRVRQFPEPREHGHA